MQYIGDAKSGRFVGKDQYAISHFVVPLSNEVAFEVW
jgi:hypothetical protein